MALNDTFNDLQSNLYRPLIFFLPESLIPENKKELFESPKLARFFNKVAMIKKSGDILELYDDTLLLEILEKGTILNQNSFLLRDQETLLSSSQFNHLMEKYLQHLQFYNTIVSWMALHITEYCNIENHIKDYFELQDKCFKSHLLEIETKFDNPISRSTEPIRILDHIEKDFSSLEKIFGKHDNNNSDSNSGFNKQLNKKRNTKATLVTEEEATRFLLKSVFNISEHPN